MRRANCFFLLAGLLISDHSAAAIFTVGADAACTHSGILPAVFAASNNGPGLDEIRVATNQTYSGVIVAVVGHSVRIGGGFSNCADTTPSGRTTIGGTTGSNSPTIFTQGNAVSAQLMLTDLLFNAAGSAARQGGALRIEGSFSAVLSNVLIRENRAARGGGIYIDGSDGAHLRISGGTLINNNRALSGGGIYCLNGGSIELSQGEITQNLAEDLTGDPLESGNGGGVALYSGCSLTLPRGLGDRDVSVNHAERHGGGVYLRNATLAIRGPSARVKMLAFNKAEVSGGGIAVDDDPAGERSEISIHDGQIAGNAAPLAAGIHLIRGGEVTMRRTLADAQCGTHVCSTLSDGSALTTGGTCESAAAHIGPDGKMEISGTLIESNCANAPGSILGVQGNGSLLVDSSVVAHNNGSPLVLQPGFSGALQVAWSTFYGNFATRRSGFIGLPNSAPATGSVRIFGSLLGEPFDRMTFLSGSGPPPAITVQFDCLAVDPVFENAGLSAIRGVELPSPYGMIAPDDGEYALANGTNLPVDWCDTSFGERAYGDAALVTQVYDAPRADQHGMLDLGAYEFVVAFDEMFANGFE